MNSELVNGKVGTGIGDSPALSDSDILVYTGHINREGFERVVSECPSERRKKVLLVLETLGGDADAAYRIARFLRRSYEHFTVFVPGLCKSAGTLLCVGAHEIVMSETGELGPLDVQVRNPEELADYGSGLDMPQAIGVLRDNARETLHATLISLVSGGRLPTKRSAEIATNVTVGLFAPIFAQIDPSRLGRNARALSIARQYAARIGVNVATDQTLVRLVAGYPSHSFAIDRDEAAELFQRVRPPTRAESELARGLVPVSSNPVIVWAPGEDQVHWESEGGTANEDGTANANATSQPNRPQ